LSDKTVYPTFARTLPPPEKIAKSIVAVLRHFNWDRVVVLAGQHGQRFIKIKDEFLVSKIVSETEKQNLAF
jgi:hypothetical protein